MYLSSKKTEQVEELMSYRLLDVTKGYDARGNYEKYLFASESRITESMVVKCYQTTDFTEIRWSKVWKKRSFNITTLKRLVEILEGSV